MRARRKYVVSTIPLLFIVFCLLMYLFVLQAGLYFWWGVGCGLAAYGICFSMVKLRLFPILKWLLLGILLSIIALAVYVLLYPHIKY